jgi:transposase-like protein
MLRYFGKLYCPNCGTDLMKETESAAAPDQRWKCNDCGYTRPVVYSVDRPRPQSLDRTVV